MNKKENGLYYLLVVEEGRGERVRLGDQGEKGRKKRRSNIISER